MDHSYNDRSNYQHNDSRYERYQPTSHTVTQPAYQDHRNQTSTNYAYQPSTVGNYQPSQYGQQTTATIYTPATTSYAPVTSAYTPTKSQTRAGADPRGLSPGRESVTLVENHPDYKVYQYRSIKKESVVIDDSKRRVVHGDTYSDGTPVKRNTARSQDSPNVPFNPRRSTTFSNSKYITVIRNGKEMMEEIYDYN